MLPDAGPTPRRILRTPARCASFFAIGLAGHLRIVAVAQVQHTTVPTAPDTGFVRVASAWVSPALGTGDRMGGPGPIPEPRQQTGSLGGVYAGGVHQKAQGEANMYNMLCRVLPDATSLCCVMLPDTHPWPCHARTTFLPDTSTRSGAHTSTVPKAAPFVGVGHWVRERGVQALARVGPRVAVVPLVVPKVRVASVRVQCAARDAAVGTAGAGGTGMEAYDEGWQRRSETKEVQNGTEMDTEWSMASSRYLQWPQWGDEREWTVRGLHYKSPWQANPAGGTNLRVFFGEGPNLEGGGTPPQK